MADFSTMNDLYNCLNLYIVTQDTGHKPYLKQQLQKHQ